jgi:hypothetical protein
MRLAVFLGVVAAVPTLVTSSPLPDSAGIVPTMQFSDVESLDEFSQASAALIRLCQNADFTLCQIFTAVEEVCSMSSVFCREEQELTQHVDNLPDEWNDRVSSYELGAGVRCTFYEYAYLHLPVSTGRTKVVLGTVTAKAQTSL